MRTIDHLIVGQDGGGSGGRASPTGEARFADVFDPNTGRVQATVTLGTAADLDRAVAAAQAAQPGWAATNPQKRARVLFAFKQLVEAHMQELAELLSSELDDTLLVRSTSFLSCWATLPMSVILLRSW